MEGFGSVMTVNLWPIGLTLMRSYLLLALVFISTSVFGEVIPREWISATHGKIKISNASFPTVRISRPNATPVILLHGIGGNAHNWMEVGTSLYKAGYDVWSFTWTANMQRDVEQAGSRTVKELVEYVSQKTGKKVFLVGHSLGGIVSKIYTLGIDRRFFTGKLFINERLKRQADKYVLGLVSLNSPSGHSHSLKKYLPILKRIPSNATLGSADLSEVIEEDRLDRDLYFVKALELAWSGSRLPLIRNFVQTMFNPKYQHYTDYNLGKLIRYGTAPVSQLITAQIGSDIYHQESATKLHHFFHYELKHIPFAYIASENDEIAEHNMIESESLNQNAPYLLLPDAGHMDPLSGELVSETVLFMIKFFRENEN